MRSSLVVVHFWASWAPQCAQMSAVLAELAALHPAARFAAVEAESVPELSVQFGITAVPTVVFLRVRANGWCVLHGLRRAVGESKIV